MGLYEEILNQRVLRRVNNNKIGLDIFKCKKKKKNPVKLDKEKQSKQQLQT